MKTGIKNILKCISGIVLLCAAMNPAVADEDWIQGLIEGKESNTRCLNLREIDNTDILNSSNLVFHTIRDEIYLNHMTNTCPGLDQYDAFMYRVTMNRLCDLDLITVLETVGGGFAPTASCSLGKFHKIDEELLNKIKKRLEEE